MPLPVRCNEVKEVGTGVFGHDPFPLYPAEILLLKIVNIPLAGQLAGAPARLEFDRVSKWYGPVIGLNEVSLRLEPGITGLVGPNGAGKSTLMKLATGQLRPNLGRVLLRGKPAARSRFS